MKLDALSSPFSHHATCLMLQLMSAEKEKGDAEVAAVSARQEFRSYRTEISRLKASELVQSCVCMCDAFHAVSMPFMSASACFVWGWVNKKGSVGLLFIALQWLFMMELFLTDCTWLGSMLSCVRARVYRCKQTPTCIPPCVHTHVRAG